MKTRTDPLFGYREPGYLCGLVRLFRGLRRPRDTREHKEAARRQCVWQRLDLQPFFALFAYLVV